VGYSPPRKSAALKRRVPPNNRAIRQLLKTEGIAEATLHKCRSNARGKGQLLPDAAAGSEGWTSHHKFAAVLQTAAMNEADLAEYGRKWAVFPAQIKAWRVACEQANDWDRTRTAKMSQATREERKRIKELERELARKDRALARSCSDSGAQKKAGGDLGRGRMTRIPDRQAATLLIEAAVTASARHAKACAVSVQNIKPYIQLGVGVNTKMDIYINQ